jgi:hypothetical protein
VILFIFYFLFFWRVLASLINMLSAQTNEFFEWKKKNGRSQQRFFFQFYDKNNLANFWKRKEKYSRIYTLTIPNFPFLAQKGRIKHRPMINFQGFFSFCQFLSIKVQLSRGEGCYQE